MASHEERRRAGIRLTVLQYLMTAIFSILAVSFWALQIVQHAKFQELAENNNQRTLALRAPRGVVFDRNGHVLVENRHAYSISIVREHTRDLDRTIALLASVLGLDESGVREIVDRHRREPSYRPIVIIQDATLAQVAAVTARRLDTELPDVVVEEVPTRRYPDGMAAHLFGYVGEVSDAQVARDDSLKSGDIVGQSGIERIYNGLLMGEDGAKRVVVNSVGREIRTPRRRARRRKGARLRLTVDYDVQKALEDGFKWSGFNGASVILDPRTGEVLAFTSVPAYDPNAFASGIDRATWAALNTDELRPLQDRAIQGRYSPGSTFKMAVATAALEEGVITPDFKVYCPGHAVFFGRPFQCWKPGGHGTIDLRHAIEQSCNVYFYTVGNMVGIDKIHKWATLLGLGREERHRPAERGAGARAVAGVEEGERPGEKWYAGETISVSIGQGQVSLTPVSMAVYISTIANGGTRVTPHLLRAVDDGTGWKTVPAPAPQSRGRAQAGDDPGDSRRLVAGRQRRRNRRPVRASRAATCPGKTGTAQVISTRGRQGREGEDDAGPARQRVVRVLRAARQPADCRRRLRGARRPRRDLGGADCEARDGDVLREAGWDSRCRRLQRVKNQPPPEPAGADDPALRIPVAESNPDSSPLRRRRNARARVRAVNA